MAEPVVVDNLENSQAETPLSLQRALTFTSMFEMRVTLSAQRPAAREGLVRLTFHELNQRANALARFLVAQGAGPGDRVALALGRSVDLLVAMLAVVKAGAAYVPLDPMHPPQRTAFILEDSDATLILLEPRGFGELPPGGRPVVDLGDEAVRADLSMRPVHDLIDRDRVRPLRPDDPVYLIYTSGSTGQPKGVVIEHRSLVAYLRRGLTSYAGLRGRCLWHSTLAFDATVTTVHGSLVSGGELHIGDLDGCCGVEHPQEDITFIKITPSHLPLFADITDPPWPTVELMFGGELLRIEAARQAALAGATLIHHYGPTETTVGCIDLRIPAVEELGDGPVPIGRPMPGVTVYVLDQGLKPVAEGVAGELYVSGAQVARGYWRQPELTAARFLDCPFEPGERMYRTGDLVRRRPDGLIEFIGRADDQVKIRGLRVEPAEIETAVLACPGVRSAAVLAHSSPDHSSRLVAYLVVDEGTTWAGVRALLREKLPAHMVPSQAIMLRSLPLTVNGKTDRAVLQALDVLEPAPEDATAPPTPEAQNDRSADAPGPDEERERLREMFATILNLPTIGPDEDFFDIGGDSLLGLRLLARVRAVFGMKIAARKFLDEPTVSGMARLLWPGPGGGTQNSVPTGAVKLTKGGSL